MRELLWRGPQAREELRRSDAARWLESSAALKLRHFFKALPAGK